MCKNIKKLFIFLVVVLNLILPLNVFAQDLEKGQGSVKEAVKSGNKEFYTIVTPNEKTYYLVIDFSKNERNVYFLKTVDEVDLLDLAGVNEIIYNSTETTEITTEVTELISEETSSDELKKEQMYQKENKLNIITIIAIIGLIALVVFLIYDKFLKKQNNNTLFEDDYEDFEEEKQEDEFLDGLANKDKE